MVGVYVGVDVAGTVGVAVAVAVFVITTAAVVTDGLGVSVGVRVDVAAGEAVTTGDSEGVCVGSAFSTARSPSSPVPQPTRTTTESARTIKEIALFITMYA